MRVGALGGVVARYGGGEVVCGGADVHSREVVAYGALGRSADHARTWDEGLRVDHDARREAGGGAAVYASSDNVVGGATGLVARVSGVDNLVDTGMCLWGRQIHNLLM